MFLGLALTLLARAHFMRVNDEEKKNKRSVFKKVMM